MASRIASASISTARRRRGWRATSRSCSAGGWRRFWRRWRNTTTTAGIRSFPCPTPEPADRVRSGPPAQRCPEGLLPDFGVAPAARHAGRDLRLAAAGPRHRGDRQSPRHLAGEPPARGRGAPRVRPGGLASRCGSKGPPSCGGSSSSRTGRVAGNPRDAILRDWMVTIRYDGSERERPGAAGRPVRDPWRRVRARSLYFGMEGDALFCAFPMPFARSAEIRLEAAYCRPCR
jgi:hypothetical protein